MHGQSEGLQGRRLKEAVKYVSRTWFPVNAAVLRQVQTKLADGVYTDQKQALIDDLKTDFALLAFCLRKLETVIAEEKNSANPIDTLRQLEIDQLKSILSPADNEISSHRFDDMRDVQALRLRHSLISCGTAEIIARNTNADPDFAYSCALLRQLGFMLVAWNYPGSFQKALAAVLATGNDIESELAKIVGFEPALLGYEVTLHWNTSPELKTALGWKVAPKSGAIKQPTPSFPEALAASEEKRKADTVARYCELGETFARVNNQQHYPQAVQQWKQVEKELRDLLGENAISTVSEHVRALCKNFVSVSNDIFGAEISPDASVRKANNAFVAKLLEDNAYVKRCPPPIQKEFREVYERIIKGEVSTEGVNLLVSRLIPNAGFVRGCIFLMDTSKAQLIPRVRIGDSKDRQYKPVSCSASGERSNPISEAFHCATPLKQERAFLHNDVVSHVSGKFGNSDKGGVLYLEMSDRLLLQENHVAVMYFKAIRQCLDHCLNLV
ncbi:MAG: HDOD domain-containing protein [Deltaproteobacteria bacterium]|nr:HDOD domain-containing protein [Deltaproteobacteria bacterium]